MFYFRCGKHGEYRVKRGTFMKFLEQSKFKDEIEKKEEKDNIDFIIEFKDRCPLCTKKGKSKARILTRDKTKHTTAPYRKM